MQVSRYLRLVRHCMRILLFNKQVASSFHRPSAEACQNASCSAEMETAAGGCCSYFAQQQLNSSSNRLGRRNSTGCIRERRVRAPCTECMQAAASTYCTDACTDSISKAFAMQTMSVCHSRCTQSQRQITGASFNVDDRTAYVKTVDAQLIASSKLLGRITPGPTTANRGMEICTR
jgi:hypothetical protein